MAEFKKQTLQCPNCQHDIEVEMRTSLEMPYDKEYKQEIMDGMFFRNKCEGCGRLIPAIYDFSYNDLENKYLIWMLPTIGEIEKQHIIGFNERLKTDNVLRMAQGGYRYRIVVTDMELREKILIFDEGLDDRYIEAMKNIYVPVILDKVGRDNKILGIFFDKDQNGEYQWMVVFDNRKPGIYTVNMNMYEDMEKRLKEAADRNYDEHTMLMIEGRWAAKVMQETSEAEKAAAEDAE